MKYKLLLHTALLIIFVAFTANAGDNPRKLNKTLSDTSSFTNIGNIGLTITNFGQFGNGLSKLSQENHPPSCEYPLGSGIEHLFAGGLWVGGFIKNDSVSNTKYGPFVTTGAVDASSLSSTRGGGFEYTNDKGSTIIQRSSINESPVFKPDAVSHQDYVMDYNDTNLTTKNKTTIVDHNPLGIGVHEECYAWNFPFADFFVIKNIWIKNITNKYLDSVYVGLYSDAVVRNTKVTSTTNSAFFSHGGLGYDDSLKISYCYDVDGDVGFTDSYIGFLFLGSYPKLPAKFVQVNGSNTDTLTSTSYVAWQWGNTSVQNFFAPDNDVKRYPKMQGYFQYPVRFKDINPDQLRTPSNRSELITHGYFKSINPGDSINVVFAILCGKKTGNDPASLDTKAQRATLYNNADWALRAYYGNDRNRNDTVDVGEDIFGDGKIHHYVLPAPPAIPIMKVVPENNKCTIYWDKRAESSIDPISGKKDFAGYKVYRTQSGFDLSDNQSVLNSLVVLSQYDSAGSTGFNTGFKSIEQNPPITFPNDPNKYYYKVEVPNLLNGWQYLFTVTSFDKGDPDNSLDPLESSLLANINRVFPGTPAVEDANTSIGVYPNPYYAHAIWDGSAERLRKIYFYNLPASCEITIYTLAGDIVKRINHDQSKNGSNTRWFEQYAGGSNKQIFSGGEHAWDLVTDNDQAIATGLYLFTVKNTANGQIKTGKFLIIK